MNGPFIQRPPICCPHQVEDDTPVSAIPLSVRAAAIRDYGKTAGELRKLFKPGEFLKAYNIGRKHDQELSYWLYNKGRSPYAATHKSLSKRDTDIIRERLRGQTYAALGRKYNLSRDRVQQIVAKHSSRLLQEFRVAQRIAQKEDEQHEAELQAYLQGNKQTEDD